VKALAALERRRDNSLALLCWVARSNSERSCRDSMRRTFCNLVLKSAAPLLESLYRCARQKPSCGNAGEGDE